MWLKRLIFALFAAALVVSGINVAAAPAHATSCEDLMVVVVPGTWETERGNDNEYGMLGELAQKLNSKGVGTVAVDYPASVGGLAAPVTGRSTPIADSIKEGIAGAVAKSKDIKKRCSGSKLAVTGFSQGALIAGDFTELVGNGKVPGLSCNDFAGSITYADPRRGKSVVDGKKVHRVGDFRSLTGRGDTVDGEGIFGPREGLGCMASKAFTFCGPDDLFCNMPQMSRNTGDLVAALAEYRTTTNSQQMKALKEAGFGQVSREVGSMNPGDTGQMDPSGIQDNPASIAGLVDAFLRLAPQLIGDDPVGSIMQALTGEGISGKNPKDTLRKGLQPDQIAPFIAKLQAMSQNNGHNVYPSLMVAPGVSSLDWGANWFAARA